MADRNWSRRKLLQLSGAAAVGLAAGPGFPGRGWALADRPLTRIEAITFPGTYNLLVWAAQEMGIFQNEGLEVNRTRTPTSMYLVKETVALKYQIAIASIDNVVAYNEGQGQIPLDRPSDLFAFMNLRTNTTLRLIGQSSIASFDDLKGKTFAVDALSTGFSFALRKILEVHGLGEDDYALASVGNAPDRLAALKKGDYVGAILTPPFDRLALAAGLKELGSTQDAFPNYQATCFISSRRWAEENDEALVGFVRAILKSMAWLKDAGNTAKAAEILTSNMPNISPTAAPRLVSVLASEFDPDLNMAGIESVLALRSQYGRPRLELTDPTKYIDTSYLERARASL